MRVAAIYDIHGNLPALDAVLDEIRTAGIERIVVGGDVLPGPMPVETLARLASLEIPTQFIQGNGEVAVLAEIAGLDAYPLPEQAREVIRWTARQLSAEHVQEIRSWPKTIREEIDGLGDVLFCHGTPRNENEIFTRLTPEEALLSVFDEVDAAVVVCGHTHMQFNRNVGNISVVNAGSVGMPFGRPGADWLLLGSTIELRHTNYDLAHATECIQKTIYPQAEEFVARNLLHPPSEEEMLKLFGRVELKR